MFLNTEPNNLKSQHRSFATVLILFVTAFLFSQSLALAHTHADGELTATCVVCHHADNSPALLPQASHAQAAYSATFTTHSFQDVALPSQHQHDYLARAPPTIR